MSSADRSTSLSFYRVNTLFYFLFFTRDSRRLQTRDKI